MIVLYIFVAWAGASAVAAGLWDHVGPVFAIVLAPFGGSALAFCAALLVYFQQSLRRAARHRPAARPHFRSRLAR